jgi:hypothetical protein
LTKIRSWYQELLRQNNGELANAQSWCTEQNERRDGPSISGYLEQSREDAEAIVWILGQPKPSQYFMQMPLAAYGQNWRAETMTPKNREELVGMLTRGFATSGVAFWTDATTGELLDALDAAGLAIVPKEPTEDQVWAGRTGSLGSDLVGINSSYRAMLEASPFKEGTTLQQKEPGE